MFVSPVDQAIAVLQDTKLDYTLREVAIHEIAKYPTPTGIQALIGALQYKEFALRWVASTALAQLGPKALRYVLLALTQPESNTDPLRESVIHILHYGSNLAQEPVYKHAQVEPEVLLKPGLTLGVGELMTALKGPAADINSMIAANKLLKELDKLTKKR